MYRRCSRKIILWRVWDWFGEGGDARRLSLARRPRCGCPCGLSRSLSAACEAAVPPKNHLWLSPTPTHPALSRWVSEPGVGGGGAHPHTLSLSHSFPVTNKADARHSLGTM